MVNISASLNSQKVQAYHTMDYASAAQKSYYSQGDAVAGHWHGHLAREMGLAGVVDAEHFRRLADGQDPTTGEQLVKHRIETDFSAAHRAGWDATFSAPKSVSITALVGGDQRIIEAHRQAVQRGLDYLERFTSARIGGNHPPERTGKWVAATFEHDTSRPVNGYSAPQLHTHTVFFNLTRTADGRPRALQERHIFEAQKVATAVYQAELGYRLRELGYELEEGKGGAREIAGYSADYLRANSSRSEQIEELAKQLEAQGLNRAEARQRAAHSTRQAKDHNPPAQTRAQQAALAADYGNQHLSIIEQARDRARSIQSETPINRAAVAADAVAYACDKHFEQEAVIRESDLLRDALRRGQDRVLPTDVEAALSDRCQSRRLLTRTLNGQSAYTTDEMLATERDNIRIVKAGQDCCRPFCSDGSLDSRIAKHFEGFLADAEKQSDPGRREQLTSAIANQQQAIRQVLASRDRVQGFQGAAGTGKTTSLTVVRRELQRAGYSVKGLAPTSRATQQLAECGAECSTLQMHLAKAPSANESPTVYFLDETSLASTKQIHQFLSRLGSNDRVVLIGDIRQHEAVEAGRAFAQLQDHGIRTARLDQIVRQKDEALRKAVEHLAENRVPDAVKLLHQQGRVTQIANANDRYQTLADEYLKDPAHTLVVSPDNRSRAAINDAVHQRLRATGQLTSVDRSVDVLVPRQDLSGSDRTWAARYQTGDVVRFTKADQAQFARGEYVTVLAVNKEQNLLTVSKADGTTVSYDPARRAGVSVYRVEKRAFATGERIQFTTPYNDRNIANRQLGTITELTKDNIVAVKLDAGRLVRFRLKDYRHLDHGYAVTSHSSQGLTTDRVLVNIDASSTHPNLVNTRLAYVAISRARYDAQIYTNDAATLHQHLGRDVSKTSALELAPSLAPAPVNQQPQQQTPPAAEITQTAQSRAAHSQQAHENAISHGHQL